MSDELVAAARAAMDGAYAPYSHFRVGAALKFDDGTVITGSNVENASYGLSLCAETVAVAKALSEGRRGGLVEVAVAASGPKGEGAPKPVGAAGGSPDRQGRFEGGDAGERQ